MRSNSHRIVIPSKTIIETHLHGTIEASNEADGACFVIRVPKEIA